MESQRPADDTPLPSQAELLLYDEGRAYVSGSGIPWERFKIGALTTVWLPKLSKHVLSRVQAQFQFQ